MEIHPKLDEFKAKAKQGYRIPVFMDLTADCETPLSAYSKLAQDKPAFLFESIVGGENISRFSFPFLAPLRRKFFASTAIKPLLSIKTGPKKASKPLKIPSV